MPKGLFRGLAKAVIVGYGEAKAGQYMDARQLNETEIPANHQPDDAPNLRSTKQPHATQESCCHNQSTQATAQGTDNSNTCPGLQGRRGGAWFKSPLMPDIDICAECYAKVIRGTYFSEDFRLINLPTTAPPKACDMAMSSVRALWSDAMAQAEVVDGDMVLRSFNENARAVNSELRGLLAQAENLQLEIQNLDSRIEMTKCSAVMQMNRAGSMGITEAINYPYGRWYGGPPSMHASQQASATGWSGIPIAQERDRKAQQLQRVVTRIQEIV